MRGDLRERVVFERRADLTQGDGAGNFEGGWVEQFTAAARMRQLRGGEEVIAQRLGGVQPVVLTVRASDQTRAITTDWRARDARRGTVYAIRAVTPDEVSRVIDLLCEAGVASG